jgi:hypothetical protein
MFSFDSVVVGIASLFVHSYAFVFIKAIYQVVLCSFIIDAIVLEYLEKNWIYFYHVLIIVQSHALTSRTSGCSFQIGPILVIDEPFTVSFPLESSGTPIQATSAILLNYIFYIADW